jgi:hypothetical protein
MELEGSLPCSQEPPPVPILNQMNLIHTLQPYVPKISLILSSHLHLSLPSGLFPSDFPTKHRDANTSLIFRAVVWHSNTHFPLLTCLCTLFCPVLFLSSPLILSFRYHRFLFLKFLLQLSYTVRLRPLQFSLLPLYNNVEHFSSNHGLMMMMITIISTDTSVGWLAARRTIVFDTRKGHHFSPRHQTETSPESTQLPVQCVPTESCSMKLISHPHLLIQSRMCGAIPPLHAWRGTKAHDEITEAAAMLLVPLLQGVLSDAGACPQAII